MTASLQDPRVRLEQADHWDNVVDVCREADRRGGTAHVVGGAVRDALLGRSVADLDVEVFGLTRDALATMLADMGLDASETGKSFAVFKLHGMDVDVSLPRRERKTGSKHTDFDVTADPNMTPHEAAERRDFTVNAVAFNPLTDNLVDPFNGVDDLKTRTLRHTSHRFAEDPLRVLRGMQFVARLGLSPHPDTVDVCRALSWEELSRERVFDEWKKLLLKGVEVGAGLRFLEATGWLASCPELEALVGCPQQSEWHPEGDAWVHTQHVMDAFAAQRTGDDHEDLVVGLACLCHDLGKPAVTKKVNGNWVSRGHEDAGVDPTRSLLARWTNSASLVDDVVKLVLDHMKPAVLFRAGARKTAVRRLANRVGRVDRLVRVARADQSGRPPKTPDVRCCDWLLEVAASLNVDKGGPDPLVMGRDVVARGVKPGPEVGRLLAQCFDAQLDGVFDSHAGGVKFLEGVME